MHWIKEKYTPILHGLMDQFVATKKDKRAAVVSDALQQITAVAEEERYDIPPLLSKVNSFFSRTLFFFV